MNKKIYCPYCNSDMVKGGFNYDTALLTYHCEECNNDFTEYDIINCECCGEQILENNFIKTEQGNFCSYDCFRDFINQNKIDYV